VQGGCPLIGLEQKQGVYDASPDENRDQKQGDEGGETVQEKFRFSRKRVRQEVYCDVPVRRPDIRNNGHDGDEHGKADDFHGPCYRGIEQVTAQDVGCGQEHDDTEKQDAQ
jgi:hypothetical protein